MFFEHVYCLIQKTLKNLHIWIHFPSYCIFTLIIIALASWVTLMEDLHVLQQFFSVFFISVLGNVMLIGCST